MEGEPEACIGRCLAELAAEFDRLWAARPSPDNRRRMEQLAKVIDLFESPVPDRTVTTG